MTILLIEWSKIIQAKLMNLIKRSILKYLGLFVRVELRWTLIIKFWYLISLLSDFRRIHWAINMISSYQREKINNKILNKSDAPQLSIKTRPNGENSMIITKFAETSTLQLGHTWSLTWIWSPISAVAVTKSYKITSIQQFPYKY